MPGFAQTLPAWNKAGTAPSAEKQTAGWAALERPPADWFNWQWNLTFLALQELQTNAVHKDGSMAFSGSPSFDAVQGTRPFSVASTTVVANLNADLLDGYHALKASDPDTVAVRDINGSLKVKQLISEIAQGTAPMTVASTTVVASLNSDLHDGFHAQAAYAVNTIPVRDASGDITSRRFISNIATGTAPLAVTSTTVVANLNADSVDGWHLDQDLRKAASPSFVSATFTAAAGTAPMIVTSDALVANLNADKVDGYSPGNASGALAINNGTLNTNLNADMLDGLHMNVGAGVNTIVGRDASGDITTRRFISNIATGTSPFSVASTTVVANLNVDMVDGYHFNQDLKTTAAPSFVALTVAGFTDHNFNGGAQGKDSGGTTRNIATIRATKAATGSATWLGDAAQKTYLEGASIEVGGVWTNFTNADQFAIGGLADRRRITATLDQFNFLGDNNAYAAIMAGSVTGNGTVFSRSTQDATKTIRMQYHDATDAGRVTAIHDGAEFKPVDFVGRLLRFRYAYGTEFPEVYDVWSGHNSPANTGSAGYQKLASGLVIQWGSVAVPANALTGPANFPIAFPTQCNMVVGTHNYPGATAAVWSFNTTQFQFQGTGTAGTIFWIAIGK